MGTPMIQSQNGGAIPIIIGRVQAAPRTIWRGPLTLVSGGKKANKKGVSGTYFADYAHLLGTMGFGRTRDNQTTSQPLQSVLSLWVNQSKYPVLYGSWTGVVSGGQVTVLVPGGGVLIQIIAATVRQSYSITLNDFGGPGSTLYTGVYNRALWNDVFHFYDQSSQQPLVGGARAPYTFSRTASVAASAVVPIHSSLNGQTVTVYFAYQTSAQKTPLALTNGEVFEPLLGASHHVAQPIVYEDVGGIAVGNAYLGPNPIFPAVKWETLGWGTASPNADVNPADVLQLIIMSPFGLNASSLLQQTDGPTSVMGDYTAMRAYCDANGIWISCYYDTQTGGAQILGDLADTANCAPVWSEGVLKMVPWSEVSQIGNGYTFTAPTASGPVATLLPSDFVCDAGKAPIQIFRSKQKESKNVLPIEYLDRNNDYAVSEATVVEGSSLSEFGSRLDSTHAYHWVHDGVTAATVGIPLVKRSALSERMTIKFRLSPKHAHLEPMDLIQIQGNSTGFLISGGIDPTLQYWRLTRANFTDKGEIDCEAEPFFYGANAPHLPSPQPSSPGTNYTNVDPGSIGVPYIFEPVVRLSSTGVAELWIGVPATNPNYGGCEVFASFDGGASYQVVGQLLGKSTMGTVITSTWPAHADPDTTNDLNLDLTESLGQLASFPAASADLFVPVCVVEGGSGGPIPYELIAYTRATLVSANMYTMNATGAGNEIRRAVFAAPSVGMGSAHVPGVTTWSTPALVQSGAASVSGTTPLTFTFGSAVTAGSTLVVGANSFLPPNFTLMTIYDNKGNAWKPIIDHIRPSYRCAGWYAQNVAAGTTTVTIVAPNANGSSFIRACYQEFSGLDGLVAFDSAAAGDNFAGGTGAWSPGTVTTAKPNGLIYTFVHNDTTLTMPAGYTAAGGIGSAQSAYKVQSAAGAYTPNWSVVGNSGLGFDVAFRAKITSQTRTAFVYLNDPVFKIPLDPKWIGTTIHFKFCAFNIFRQAQQPQAVVTDYPYAVTGVAAAIAGTAPQTYIITPSNPLSQGASSFNVVMAQCTATFSPTGVVTNYNTRTFAVADPGAGNTQQYWVTVQDPGHIGDTGGATTLSAFCDNNQTKWNTAGYIRIGTIIVTHPGGGSGSGGGSTAGSAMGTLIITDSGDHLNFTLNKPVTTLMLFRNGDYVDPSDYTFTGSGFTLHRIWATGDNLNAVGA
jgi:hypothetical protein